MRINPRCAEMTQAKCGTADVRRLGSHVQAFRSLPIDLEADAGLPRRDPRALRDVRGDTSGEDLASLRTFPNQIIHIPPLRPARNSPPTIGRGLSPSHFADWHQRAGCHCWPVQQWSSIHNNWYRRIWSEPWQLLTQNGFGRM
jgi:hypothetical protein